MSVPAWKQAILDRKKKAEEEAKKKEEEEASYLASLPPWKRAIVKKRTPGSTLERKDSKEKSSNTSASDPGNKWKAAVQNVKPEIISSPKQSSRPSWAKKVPGSTSEQSVSKEPIISSTSSNTHAPRPIVRSFSGTLSAFTKEPSQTTSVRKQPSTVKPAESNKVNSAPTTSVTSQIAREPTSTASITRASPSITSGGVSLRSKESQPATVVPDKRRSFEGDDDEDAKLAAMPAWKKAIILRRRAAASQPNKEPWAQQTQPSRNRAATAPQGSLQSVKNAASMFQKKKEPEKSSRETLAKNKPSSITHSPPVKPNTNIQATEEVDYPHEPTVEFEKHIDPTPVKPSAVKNTRPSIASTKKRSLEKSTAKETKPKTATHASKSPSAKPITTKKTPSQPELSSKDERNIKNDRSSRNENNSRKKPQPEIVNRSKTTNEVSNKMVEQEGFIHRPPAYKVVDEWADVSENDPRFKKLPMWKQALIKRRRSDYAKRIAPPPPPESKDKKKSSNVRQTDSKNANQPLSNNAPSSTQSKFQPVRKAPPRPTPTPPPPEPEPEEPMFSFSFSKKGSNHRTLDAGSESEDSDFDLEDVTLTNIDDSSDEDNDINKGGIVVTSYKVTSTDYGEADNNQTNDPGIEETDGGMVKSKSKSILMDPDNKKRVNTLQKSYTVLCMCSNFCDLSVFICSFLQKLRRVSFSDSALTEEHFYPKYIYQDYDEVNEESEGTDNGSNSNNNSGLSQRIHPSLLSSNETDRYSPSKISPMKPSSLGQYTPSIMSNYSDMMTTSYSYNSNKSTPSKEEKPMYNGGPVNDSANDFYSGLNTDTAALLW